MKLTFKRATNASGAAARLAGALVTRKRIAVSEEEYETRLEICKSCREYNELQNRCEICGCILAGKVIAKALWSTEKCPLGKWKESKS